MNHPIAPIVQPVESPIAVGKLVSVSYKSKSHVAKVIEIRECTGQEKRQMLLIKLVRIRQPILVWANTVRVLPEAGSQVSILYQPWYDHQVANNERTGLSTELSKREVFWLSQIAVLEMVDENSGMARIGANQKKLTLPLDCLTEYEINF